MGLSKRLSQTTHQIIDALKRHHHLRTRCLFGVVETSGDRSAIIKQDHIACHT